VFVSCCLLRFSAENLLLDNKNNIKIADFGMAQLMKKDGFLKTSCGSPHYASPEIIEGVQYDARCTDVWSCGVILFALITGSLPFDHDNIPTLLTMVTKGHYTTPAHVPADIAHLISRMLTVDPVKRITLPEIRRHICFKGKGYFNEPKSDGLSIESVARGISAPQVGPAWKSNDSTTASTSQKRTKVSSREHLSHPPQTNFDHEEGEPQEHAWRKTRDSKNTALVHTADAKDLSPPNQPPFLLQTGSVATTKVHHPPQEEIDEAVLNDLESLGLGARDGNRDDLRRKIRSHGDGKEPSLEQVFYKLLKQRKQDRLKQLEVLSPKVGPQPPRVRRQSSHRHSSHTTGSVPSSRQGSNLNSPTGQQTAGGELTELTLPPPHPRSSPSASNQSQQDDSVMSDVTQSTSSSTQPASSSTGTGTSMYQPSTQFAGAGAFAATLFDMAAGENKSSSTSTTTKESLSRDAISVDVMRTSPDVTVPAGAVPALPMGSPPAVIAVAPPPMIHCFSDGSVPPSILQTDDSETAASYYLAMAASAHAPPPLILSSSNSQGGTSSGVEELPPSPSPSSSCSSLSRTGPSTPMAMDERMSQSAYSAYGGTAESPALPPQSSSSANVSPALTHREKLSYARRMSTPQATGREQVYQSGPARRLFADDDSATETPHRSNQQRALDEYSQRMVLAQAAAAAPASEHMMDVDSSEAIAVPHEKSSSMPMQPRDALMSPPLLALPKHASGPHIRVPLQTSESSGSEEETTTEVARPRPRAYSQDEANLLNTSMHHRPTDRILSNVRTPVVHGESPSELPSYGGHSHVGYTTSPRFHRVRIEEQPAAAGGAGLSSGAAGHAGGSTRTPMGIKSSQHANPPSPQNSAKRSWFSSVFGNTSFGLFDRLKGNSGSSNGGGEKNAASKHHESPPNRIQAPYAQNISGSPSPILSPASANSQGVRTKRATLTLANELTKVFAQTGVSFLHNGGYRFIGSHIGATSNLPEHHVLPPKAHSNSSAMPPQMPLMQRAVSEPECEQSSTIRPRSKSIAVESSPCSPKDSREDDSQMYSVRDRTQPVPSTPKPTPTRALNQPIQLQSLMQYPNVSPPHQDSRDHTRPSFDRTDSNSSGSGNESSGSISNSVVSQNYFSATGTSSSASSSSHPPVVGSPPGSAARSKNNTAIALFGPSAVRFAVDISELPGDMRLITLTRKSGDPAAFERIQAFVREKLRLVEGSH
jgi:hypothetical protein